MAWAITAAQRADGDAVIALWQACGLIRPWNDPQADVALALRTPTSTILIARDNDALPADSESAGGGSAGGGIAGSVMVGFDGHRGWVYYLAVATAARRGGAGRALMAAAEDWLRGQGAPKIQLMVRADNAAALGFYESLGLERQPVVTLGRFLKDDA